MKENTDFPDLLRESNRRREPPSPGQPAFARFCSIPPAATARKPELLYDLRQEEKHADARGNDAETVERQEKNLTLPPFPPSMTQAKLDLTVPIRFSLR